MISLRNDRRGSAAVEFGLIGLVCLTLILETMQAGLFFCCSVFLEHATDKAARAIQTGAVALQSLGADQFRSTVVCAALPFAMPCSRVIVDVRNANVGVDPSGFYAFVKSDRSGVLTPPMDSAKTSFCPGQQGAHVVLRVFYAMPVISPFWIAMSSVTWNGGPVHFVTQTAVFKDEPFGASNAATC